MKGRKESYILSSSSSLHSPIPLLTGAGAEERGCLDQRYSLSLLPPFLNFLKASSWIGVERKDQICLPKEEEETIFCNVSWSLSSWLAVSSSPPPLVAVLWYYNLQFRARSGIHQRFAIVLPYLYQAPSRKNCGKAENNFVMSSGESLALGLTRQLKCPGANDRKHQWEAAARRDCLDGGWLVRLSLPWNGMAWFNCWHYHADFYYIPFLPPQRFGFISTYFRRSNTSQIWDDFFVCSLFFWTDKKLFRIINPF